MAPPAESITVNRTGALSTSRAVVPMVVFPGPKYERIATGMPSIPKVSERPSTDTVVPATVMGM